MTPFERIDNGVAHTLHEMRAFGYDWKPQLAVKDADQTQAEAAMYASARLVRLSKTIEHVWQELRRNASTAVGDRH